MVFTAAWQRSEIRMVCTGSKSAKRQSWMNHRTNWAICPRLILRDFWVLIFSWNGEVNKLGEDAQNYQLCR